MNAALLSRFGKIPFHIFLTHIPEVSILTYIVSTHADLIFILLDRPDERHDRLISEHIMHAHGPGGGPPPTKRQRTGGYESHDQESLATEATLAQRLRHQIDACVQQFGASTGGNRRSGVISVELMRRYIEYAKRYVEPTLSPGAAKVLQRLYLTMRAQASSGQSIPVTTRHLESLIRLAQARARVDLREEVPHPSRRVFYFW